MNGGQCVLNSIGKDNLILFRFWQHKEAENSIWRSKCARAINFQCNANEPFCAIIMGASAIWMGKKWGENSSISKVIYDFVWCERSGKFLKWQIINRENRKFLRALNLLTKYTFFGAWMTVCCFSHAFISFARFSFLFFRSHSFIFRCFAI